MAVRATESGPRRPRRRRRWFALGAIGCGILAALLLGELALRIAGYSRTYLNPHQAFYQPDPRIGYIGKPDFEGRFQSAEFDAHIVQNAEGFRAVEHRSEAPHDHRLLVFGDSFVWGWGVSQGKVVTDRLAALLPEYDVRNYGVSGTGTLQQLVLFREFGAPRLTPGDVVVLVFFGNDFADCLSGRLHARVENGVVTVNDDVDELGGGLTDRVKNRLKDSSYLFNLIVCMSDRISARLRDPRGRRVADAGEGRPGRVVVRQCLAEFRDTCAAKGARLIVCWNPGQFEIGDSPATAEERAFEPPLREAFFAVTAELGLETLDLAESFHAEKRAHPDQRLTFEHDEHWCAAGHAVAADAIARRVRAAK